MPWLTILVLLPVVGSFAVAWLPTRRNVALTKQLALGVSLVVLVLTVVVAVQYQPDGGFQFSEDVMWIRSLGAHYALGVDGLGLSLIVLTAILTPVVILASWNDGDDGRWSTAAFFGFVLALEGLSIGVFAATDTFLFYVLFEATLFPIYFLIAGWGGPRRGRAAAKFLLFSLTGGLIMLASVIGLYVESAKAGTPSYLTADLAALDFSTTTGRLLFVGFFIAFAIKAPMFPVHTWLPDSAEQGTPGTSVLLVSVLDKVGTFAMVRYCLNIFPDASRWATPVVVVLAVISILYGALLAIGQDNISRLIAFTSVSHFGFIVLGIFVMNAQGQNGANLYMFNHGLSTAALFLGQRLPGQAPRGSASIRDYGGVEKVAPVLAGFLLVSGLSSLSLPGLAPFVSELLVIVGAWGYSPWAASFAVLGIVLAAIYILFMYQRVFTGPERGGAGSPEAQAKRIAGFKDLGPREIAAVAPLLVLIVILGFYPKPLQDVLQPTVCPTR